MGNVSRRRRAVGRGRDTGSISVEFALVAPLLVLLLLIVLDMGRYFFVQISLNSASHEAVRVASLREVSGPSMVSFANATAPGAAGMADGSEPPTLTIKACATTAASCTPTTLSSVNKYCNANVLADQVFVEVSTVFKWWTPVLSSTTTTIKARGVMLCSI